MFIALAGLLAGGPVARAEATPESAGKFSWKTFGISEGFTRQSTFSGLNLSTLPHWNPKYRLLPMLHIEGILGGTVMNSNKGYFFASRAQAGVSFHNIAPGFFAGKDRWVPELLLGIEHWAVKEGGVFGVLNANVHYRFHFEANRWLKMLDSVYMGYQQMFNAPHSTKQYILGIRFVPFFADEAPKAEPEPAPVVVAEEPAPIPPETVKATLAEKMNNIAFETGGTKLTAGSGPALDEMAKLLEENAQVRVRIVGYTDNVGKASRNQALSEKRAAAVAAALTERGVDQARLESLGRGAENPLSDNATPEGRAKNRRVEIEVLP